jgi:hypothetical protein
MIDDYRKQQIARLSQDEGFRAWLEDAVGGHIVQIENAMEAEVDERRAEFLRHEWRVFRKLYRLAATAPLEMYEQLVQDRGQLDALEPSPLESMGETNISMLYARR